MDWKKVVVPKLTKSTVTTTVSAKSPTTPATTPPSPTAPVSTKPPPSGQYVFLFSSIYIVDCILTFFLSFLD